MSSFLAATLAIFAHATPFGNRPSVKKRSTRGPAKLWIGTGAQHTWTQYTVSRYPRRYSGSGQPRQARLSLWEPNRSHDPMREGEVDQVPSCGERRSGGAGGGLVGGRGVRRRDGLLLHGARGGRAVAVLPGLPAATGTGRGRRACGVVRSVELHDVG